MRKILTTVALLLAFAAPAAGQTFCPASQAALWSMRALVMFDSINANVGNISTNNAAGRTRRRLALEQLLRLCGMPPKVDTVVQGPPAQLDTTAVRLLCSPRSGPSVLVGDTIRFRCEAFDSAGNARAYRVGWASRSPGIATIDAGLARGVSVGRAWLAASVLTARDSVVLEVRAPAPIPPDPTEPGTCSRTLTGLVQGNLTLTPGERLCVGADLQVAGNVLVKDAVLQMRAGSNLRISGANPNAYVGGGLQYSAAVDSDRGVWVWGTGQLDVACTPKASWNRTGTDPSWRAGDELWITPTDVGDFAPRRWTPGQPIPTAGPGVPPAEVVNVTRDCTITGPGHIHINSTKPQRIEYVTLRDMGVSNAASGGPALGRYALHLHMMGEAARGTVVRGVAAVGSRGHVFVPHSSHGVTMIDNVSVESWGAGMWWDFGHRTDDLLVDRMLVCGVEMPEAIGGAQSSTPAYAMVAGANTEMRNSVACGARGSGTYAVGFDWPEPTNLFDNVQCCLVWKFDQGNVAHNNRAAGLRFWNNNGHAHIMRQYASYRNAGGSIDNGAYLNGNVYDGVTSFEDGYVFGNDFSSNRSAITWNNSSTANSAGIQPGISNFNVRALTGNALVIGHRQLPADLPTDFVNCTLTAGPGESKVYVSEGVNPARVRFVNCDVIPDDIVFHPDAENNGSEILITHRDGRRWRVTFENGQKVVRPLSEEQQSAAELPRVRVDTALPVTTGTRRVPSGGDLQAALNAAQVGDRVLLAPGATYTGNFTLPAKSGSGWVVVQTETALPAEGVRVTPSTAASYAKILTPNPDPAVATIGVARRYRFVGVEVGVAAGVPEVFSLIRLGDGTESTLAQIPGDIIFDRVYVHGRAGTNLQRCLALNAAALAVVDSHVSECHYSGADSQAAAAWNTPGPILLRNNYLEGAGENVMFGGADSRSPEMIPADIEVVGNTIAKPAAWFTSRQWTVKNLLEVKTATRVLIEGNAFDGSWRDGQTGHAFQLFSVNQDGNSPWSYASDITFRKNVIRNVAAGFTLSARFGSVAAPLSRVLIEDNRFENLGALSPYTSADESRYLFGLLDDLGPIHVRHNTYASAGLSNQVVFEGTVPGLVFENNVIGPAEYGFQNAGELGTIAPGGIVRGNVLAPATWNELLPAGNCIVWPPTATACSGAGAR